MTPSDTFFTVANLDPDSLPANAAGASSADIIVVSQDDLYGSRPLRGWLVSGGIVIVPGIPVVEAPTSVPASAILGKAAPGLVPVIKLTGRPNGRTLVASGSMPLIYEQRVGLGKVIYLAFNPSDRALLRQPAYDNLWRQILLSACSGRTPVANGGSWFANTWLQDLSRQGMVARPPKVYMVAAFLGAYILLLVPINYFILRRLRRKELAWATIPALVIIFSLAAYVAGSVSREKKLMAASSQVYEMIAGSGAARYHGNLSLFSPNRSRHTIEFPDPSALVSDTGFGGSAGSFPILQSLRARENLVLPNADLFMWSVRTLEFDGIRPVTGTVSANLTTDGTRVKGTISSSLPFPLKDCILYGDRFHKEIGDLLPGAVLSVDEPFKLVTKGARWKPLARRYASSFAWRIRFMESSPDRLTLSGRAGWTDGQVYIEGAKVDVPFDMAYIHIYPRWVNGPDGKVTGSIAGATSDHSSYYGSPTGDTEKEPRSVRLETTFGLGRDSTCYAQYRLPPLIALYGLSLVVGLDKPVAVSAQVYDNLAEKWVNIGSGNATSVRYAVPNPKRMVGLGGIVQIKLKRAHDNGSPVQVNARLAFQGKVQ